MEEVRAYLEKHLERTRAKMRDALSSDVSALDNLNQTLLERHGKMVRPTLGLLSADICGGITERSVDIAAATELLHTATLMHDDVIDNASQRRGIPSVMSLIGASAAVLVGDYWLVKAVHCILGRVGCDERMIRAFSKTLSDLAEGELLQMQKAESLDTTEEDYIRINYGKTASLFESSAILGALSVGATPEQIEALATFGRNVGHSFQIRDDILDYGGGTIGKPSRADLRERKITLPLLCVEGSVAKDLREQIRRGNIDSVYEAVVAAGGIDLAYERSRVYIDAATRALAIFPDGPARRRLVKLANYISDRSL